MTVVWLLVNAHSSTLDSARFVPLAALARHHITLAGLPHCELRSMRQVTRYTFFNVRPSFSQQIPPCQLMYVSLHHAVMLCHASPIVYGHHQCDDQNSTNPDIARAAHILIHTSNLPPACPPCWPNLESDMSWRSARLIGHVSVIAHPPCWSVPTRDCVVPLPQVSMVQSPGGASLPSHSPAASGHSPAASGHSPPASGRAPVAAR